MEDLFAQSGQSVKVEAINRKKKLKKGESPKYKTILEATVPKDEVWIFKGVERDSEGNFIPIIKKIRLQKPQEA